MSIIIRLIISETFPPRNVINARRRLAYAWSSRTTDRGHVYMRQLLVARMLTQPSKLKQEKYRISRRWRAKYIQRLVSGHTVLNSAA